MNYKCTNDQLSDGHPVILTKPFFFFFFYCLITFDVQMAQQRLNTLRQQQRFIQLGTTMIYGGHFTSALTQAKVCSREKQGTDALAFPASLEHNNKEELLLKSFVFSLTFQNKCNKEKTV